MCVLASYCSYEVKMNKQTNIETIGFHEDTDGPSLNMVSACKNSASGSGKTTQWLTALAALKNNLDSIASTYIMAKALHNTSSIRKCRLLTASGTGHACCVHIHMQANIHAHEIKANIYFIKKNVNMDSESMD